MSIGNCSKSVALGIAFAVLSLMIFSSTASAATDSENGCVIAKDSVLRLSLSSSLASTVSYEIRVTSGGTISVYLIDQDQYSSLIAGNSFEYIAAMSHQDGTNISDSGTVPAGDYYLVIANGLSSISTGQVTINYEVTYGPSAGAAAAGTLIGIAFLALFVIVILIVIVTIIVLSRRNRNRSYPPIAPQYIAYPPPQPLRTEEPVKPIRACGRCKTPLADEDVWCSCCGNRIK
jgi:hypothetical protein